MDSYRAGNPERSVGHALAMLTAAREPAAVEQALALVRTAYSTLRAPTAAEDLTEHVNNLALRAANGNDIADVDVLTATLLEHNFYELTVAAADAFPEFQKTISLPGLAIRYSRDTAQGVLDGLSKEEASRRASATAVAFLTRMLADNPHDDIARVVRIHRNLDVEHYKPIFDDLRALAQTRIDDRFVQVSLCSTMRSIEHPEVVAAIDKVVDGTPDDPAQLENWFYTMMSMQAVPQAFRLLDRLIKHYPEYEIVHALRAMADDADQAPAAIFGKAPSGRHLVYGSMVCWGQTYLDLMEKTALSSLAAPGNIPAFCAQHDLVIDLVTMPSDLPQIAKMPVIQELAKHCQIRIYAFPDILERFRDKIGRISYLPYGFGTNLTIQRAARHGADLTFFLPDLVYGESFYSFVAGLVTRDPVAFFSDGLNTDAIPMLEGLAPHVSATDGSLAISGADLIDLSVRHLLPRTTDFYFKPHSSKVMSYPQRVVFREKEGLVVHSFSKLAVYTSHAAFMPLPIINYTTPDAQFVEHLLHSLPKKYIHYIDNTEKCVFVELCRDTGRLWPSVEMPLVRSIEKLFYTYGFHINTFHLFDNGILYPTRVDYSDEYTTAEERAELLSALAEARRTRSTFTELGPERAKYGRAALDAAKERSA